MATRTIKAAKGVPFGLAIIDPTDAVTADDDPSVTIYPERQRSIAVTNVAAVTRTIKGHAVTRSVKSGRVAIPRGDLLAMLTAADCDALAVRFPEHGEPTESVDVDVSRRFAAWLASQSTLTIGSADAAAVADL